ncbi:WecB/TagA/CpsF family glycosyltransferase [Paraburkholderia sacchari]|uniref:WecB/TagA/CpsF family glycosyltransferase n=1 Tax=Paraburkholderia sacchari TaxID=159450 RepID=UPI000541D374|nr:WecB/TagA/CpsF family glycosyltransferase [Paraburkholderia sacchari]NLP62044.1 WecB/TagA/CpsF family glycosyltransferase [Paraburkholderia sacchari]
MKRINIFSCPMDIASIDETVDWIADRASRRQFTQHVVVNVAKLVNMSSDSSLAASVRNCDLINIDGMGVVWAARLLGHAVPERVAGIDLFERLVKMSAVRGFPVFFLGGTEEVVEQTCAKLKAQFPTLKVAGFHHGYFWDDEQEVVEKIRSSGAMLLFVAITSPKKEIFIERWKERLGVDFVMGVGGTFDVIAGKVRRAPKWMQMAGMEWLFRVIQEPRRMWRRYLITNSKFALMLIKARIVARVGSTI